MGQQVGRMPEDRESLQDEWRRVLHWSAEVLARADDNISFEDSFLMDYDNASIGCKVDIWLDVERSIMQSPEDALCTHGCFIEFGNELKYKMRKDYNKAYKDLRRFAKYIDELAEKQRKIHKKILDLEKVWQYDTKKFRRKLGLLRIKVFKNLRLSEKMLFHEQKLKKQFVRRVCDIDHINMQVLEKRVKRVINSCQEKAAATLDEN